MICYCPREIAHARADSIMEAVSKIVVVEALMTHTGADSMALVVEALIVLAAADCWVWQWTLWWLMCGLIRWLDRGRPDESSGGGDDSIEFVADGQIVDAGLI